MKNTEFIEKLKNVADNHKTLYVMGCIGAPITGKTMNRYLTNNAYNMQPERTAMIKAAVDKKPPVFGFDCVCLIKSILWGWKGDSSMSYGGATYASNEVPDISADQMIVKCTDVSADFKNIMPGEAVWLPGHIGVYIGDGKVIECSPKWTNSVQYTACLNVGPVSGLNRRTWQKHGKLPYIDYTAQPQLPESVTEAPKEITAKLITITAIMNGKPTRLTSILHNNENYIRIRDLADAQQDDNLRVDWDAVNKEVVIESK